MRTQASGLTMSSADGTMQRGGSHPQSRDVAPHAGASHPRDAARQIANLLGAAGQIGATVWLVASGAGDYFGQPTEGGETAITLAMLAASTAIVAAVTAATRNAWYAGAAGWAVTATAVANAVAVGRPQNLLVASAAGFAALVVGAALWWGRRRDRNLPQR